MADIPQAIDIVAISTVFKDWIIYETARDTNQDSIDGIGAKPALPQFVDADADYNDITAERTGYDTDLATWTIAVNENTNARKLIERNLINTPFLPANTWVRVDVWEMGDPGTTDYWWIGYNTNDAPGYVTYLRAQHDDDEPAVPLTNNMDA